MREEIKGQCRIYLERSRGRDMGTVQDFFREVEEERCRDSAFVERGRGGGEGIKGQCRICSDRFL